MQLLPVGQLAYNNATTKTTSVLSFFTNYDYYLVTTQESKEFAKIAQKTSIKVIQMRTLHNKLQKDIRFLSHCAAHYYNKRKSKSPIFLEGDKIYLLQKNIKMKQLSKKLDYTKLGPFKVKAVKGFLNYKLKLLLQMKIHPVFYVMYFEPADNNTPLETNLPKIDLDNQEIKYKVKAILDQQEVNGQPRFLIKWRGYSHSNNI